MKCLNNLLAFGHDSKKCICEIFYARLGWFTAYPANVFLTKLQGPILPRKSRDHMNPNNAS